MPFSPELSQLIFVVNDESIILHFFDLHTALQSAREKPSHNFDVRLHDEHLEVLQLGRVRSIKFCT